MSSRSSASRKQAATDTDAPSRIAQRSRAALLRAARRAFEKRGFHNTRITDITAGARMAVGSFYTYFDSKEQIFEALVIDMENQVYDAPERAIGEGASPLQRIRATNEVYLLTYQRNAKFWAAIEEAALGGGKAREIQTVRHAESRDRTLRTLRIWQSQGLIRTDIDLDFAASCLGAMTERCAYLWFVHGEPVEMPDAIDKLTAIWGDVLGLRDPVPPGRAPSSRRATSAQAT
jgi:AcrR family transcriptional regulator